MNHIGIIPARGGSKRLPRKNIRLCAGRPLLYWTAAAALGSGLHQTFLSTDDEEIASLGRDLGLDIIRRPGVLAGDTTPMVSVLGHAWEQLTLNGMTIDSLVVLQPTSPLRLASHIDGAVSLYETSQAETVVSITDITSNVGPEKFMRIDSRGEVTPTGEKRGENVVMRNGPAVLVIAPRVIERGSLYGNPTFGYRMERQYSIDIDDDIDFTLAELLLLRRQGKC